MMASTALFTCRTIRRLYKRLPFNDMVSFYIGVSTSLPTKVGYSLQFSQGFFNPSIMSQIILIRVPLLYHVLGLTFP